MVTPRCYGLTCSVYRSGLKFILRCEAAEDLWLHRGRRSNRRCTLGLDSAV